MTRGAPDPEADARRGARRKAILATLMTHYRLSPAACAALTQRQILDYYWHKRNRDGAIEIPDWDAPAPERPATLESDLAAIDMLEAALGGLVKGGDAAREALRRKYARGDGNHES